MSNHLSEFGDHSYVVMKITAKENDVYNIFVDVSVTPVRPTIISAFELQ